MTAGPKRSFENWIFQWEFLIVANYFVDELISKAFMPERPHRYNDFITFFNKSSTVLQ